MLEDKTFISLDDFKKVLICVGTILEAKLNEKARHPAYILTIDFGPYGIKQSSAQITQHYNPESLSGKQVIAVMNFPNKKIAGINSEVLVLASVSEESGTVLLCPTHTVPNGASIA